MKVVYVEDEPEMVDLVRLILQKKGIEVYGANGGKQGLAKIQEIIPDLVLLDLMMPDMDGWELLRQIKEGETTEKIPVVIITAKAQMVDKVLGLQATNVDDYIVKPFSSQQLIECIERLTNDLTQ
jgi:DNA-binding response OmpR family regulator